jgi:hypothetical protein
MAGKPFCPWGNIMSNARAFGATLLACASVATIQPAQADSISGLSAPIAINDDLTFKPLLDSRLRWEDVQQPAKNLSADAVTMRVRAGLEIADKATHLSFLAEAAGTLALDTDYNAFPYKNLGVSQYRTAYSVVADPQNIALNRLQLQYKTKAVTLTAGRQRINLDDERWVGSVGWRQNEQTFDALRGQLMLAPVTLDVSYADHQRTIYGIDGGARAAYSGRFWFLGAGVKTGPVTTKAFGYLVDYDNDAGTPQTARNAQTGSSQTYGLRSVGLFPLAKGVSLSVAGSYARQSNYGTNSLHYAASYMAAEGGLNLGTLTLKGGYELMGSDAGLSAVQTPMATLHKFDGWADVFLTTPANGLADHYAGVAYKFARVKAIPGLNAQVTYHQFDSDIGAINYGHEWDGAIGFKTGRVTWMAKYADYIARGGGTTDTRKVWLQAEFGF